MMMKRAAFIVALFALVAAAAGARPALECVAASTVVPTDGSFSLFPKQFHMISSTEARANTTSLATTVRRHAAHGCSFHRLARVLTWRAPLCRGRR
jgi:hypothetical protein